MRTIASHKKHGLVPEGGQPGVKVGGRKPGTKNFLPPGTKKSLRLQAMKLGPLPTKMMLLKMHHYRKEAAALKKQIDKLPPAIYGPVPKDQIEANAKRVAMEQMMGAALQAAENSAIAAAPYYESKMAPKAPDGGGITGITIHLDAIDMQA